MALPESRAARRQAPLRAVETPSEETARPRVSLIAPMLNEAEYIPELVADLAAQDIEEPFEVVIADGGSTDGSRELLRAEAAKAGVAVSVLENPKGHASAGLNVCIRHSIGEIVVRLDCHTRYPADYVRRCVAAVRETGAWNAAGVFEAIGRTPMERAVACALDSPFGGHNWTRKLAHQERTEVDTNYLGAFPREALDRVGLYDEDLIVVEVEDLNLRLRQAGGKVILDPEIKSYYYPRGTYRAVFRQYFRYGYYKVSAMSKHGQVVSGRSMAPVAFVLSLLGLGIAGTSSSLPRKVLAGEVAAYGLAAVAFGAAAVRSRRESSALLPRVASVFPVFHLAHGLGMVTGAFRYVLGRR